MKAVGVLLIILGVIGALSALLSGIGFLAADRKLDAVQQGR